MALAVEEIDSVELSEQSEGEFQEENWEFVLQKEEAGGDDEAPYLYVFGPVLVPEEVDYQGDVASAEVIKETAHDFLEHSRSAGLIHTYKLNSSHAVIVESYVAPQDMTIEKRKVKAGTWLAAMRVYDGDLKELIRKGKLKGFSIGGSGKGVKLS